MIPQDEYKSLGFGQLVTGAAAALISTVTGGIPAGTRLVLCTPETAAVRWRDDGTDPTASVGYPLPLGSELRYDGQIARLSVISQGGAGVLNLAFYG